MERSWGNWLYLAQIYDFSANVSRLAPPTSLGQCSRRKTISESCSGWLDWPWYSRVMTGLEKKTSLLKISRIWGGKNKNPPKFHILWVWAMFYCVNLYKYWLFEPFRTMETVSMTMPLSKIYFWTLVEHGRVYLAYSIHSGCWR